MMRARYLSPFSCPSCLLALVALAFGMEPGIEPPDQHLGRWRDPYHRVDKQGPITASPNEHPLARREETCGDGYYLCDKSVSGDCCPTNYACATDSCYAQTLNPQTFSACGKIGWYPCPLEAKGGCCPVGYICGSDCELPQGAAVESCPADYSMCPASLNYGCCQSGYACGSNICSPTEATSGVFTRTTVIEDDEGDKTTSETVITTTWTPTASDTVPTTYTEDATAQQVLKYYPSKVAKVASSGSDDDDDGGGGGGGGLPTSTIGGIIGGGVALVVIIVLVTIFIHFRLRHNERIMESEKRSSTKRSKTDYTATKTEDDSVTQTGAGQDTPRPGRNRTASSSSLGLAGPGPTPDANDTSNYAPFGQPSNGSGWGGYSAVPTGGSEGVRHPSVDSSQGGGQSYFDHRVSAQTAPTGYRYSSDSNPAGSGMGTPYSHGRQWSGGSAGEGYTGFTPQELDSRDIIGELAGSPDPSPGSPSAFGSGSSATAVGNASGSGSGSGLPGQLYPPSPSGRGSGGPTTPDGGISSGGVSPGVSTLASGSRRRASSQGGVANRPPLTHLTASGGRRRSDSAHQRGRSDSSNSAVPTLSAVTEQHEGAPGIMMHGYYGPDRQVGQTAAGLRETGKPPEARLKGPEEDGDQEGGQGSSAADGGQETRQNDAVGTER